MAISSNKAVNAAIAANVAVTTLKFIGAAITGSSAMLSEGVHSLVDTGDSILLLVGLRLSLKPPDRKHPLGHGRELYFWSMVVAMIIFGGGCCVNVFEGVSRIMHPRPIESASLSYVILACAAAFDGVSLTIGFRQFRRRYRETAFFKGLRRSKDPTTFAVILEDASDLLGIGAAFLGIWLSQRYRLAILDGVASIVIGGILASVAFLLGRECHGLLIGEAADDSLLQQIRDAARLDDRIKAMNDPLTLHLGPRDVMLALSVAFRDDLDAKALAATIDDMQAAIRSAVPQITRIFIEAEAISDRAQPHRNGTERPNVSGSPGEGILA
jgi:cation diffusion facilitator family transporter